MREETRQKLLVILDWMGILPEYVCADGATSDGYRTFLFDNEGKRCFDDSHRAITRFVPWNPQQKGIIEQNKELFEEWFED